MDLFRLRLVFIVCILYTTISCGRSEPSCSKFDYEEKLLEKMIKMEDKFDKMEKAYTESRADFAKEKKKVLEETNTMKATIEQFVEDGAQKLTTMKATIEQFVEDGAQQLTTMEDDVKNEKERMVKEVNDASAATERTLQENEAKLVRLSGDLRVFQNETISDLTGLLKTPDVFFTAKDLVDKSLSKGQIFVFPTLVENRGEGYNKASGVFTAPVDGDYIFTTQMCNTHSQFVYLAFVVDDMIQKPMRIYAGGSTCATDTLMSRLKAGARVAIKCTSSANVIFDSSRYGSHFSGYLLRNGAFKMNCPGW